MLALEALFLSILLFIIVNHLDHIGEKPDSSPMIKRINSTVFCSYRCRFVVYFAVFLPFIVELIWTTFSYFLSLPLHFTILYLSMFLMISIASMLFAKERDRRRSIFESRI